MNKIIVVICIFTIAFISFTIGYKIGDSRGYDAGYSEGYTYDCRVEIESLQHIMKNLQKSLDFQRKHTLETNRRLDSVAYHSVYGFRDSVRAAQYSKDSVMNWDKARRYNDSVSVNGVAPVPRKCPNGEVSAVERLLQAMGTTNFSGPVNCQNNRR